MRQAVILAGGKGTRLVSRLNGLPKPLVNVDGMPLLERQLRQLSAAGFTEVLLLVSHRREAIEAFCAQIALPGLKIAVRDDGETPRGTAGAVYDARSMLAERFLVVYGDTLFDIDLLRFWASHEAAHAAGALGTLFLHPNDHPQDSDLVEMHPDGLITTFHPKPHLPGTSHRNLVNAALYVLERQLIMDFPAGTGVVDYGRDILPSVAAAGPFLRGYITHEYIKDLGTPERLDRVTADLRSGRVARARLSCPQKAVFLDRDGTLNRPAGHIATPEKLELFPDAGAAVRRLNQAEYRCVAITNQPVIARGECSVKELERIHTRLESELGEKGAFLDALYYCPHHPDAGYVGEVSELKIPCTCRKPAPGLILQAARDLSIDLAQSWFVGDSAADIGAARAAGVRSILVRTGGQTAATLCENPDYEVGDIGTAAWLIAEGTATIRATLASWLPRIQPGMMIRLAGQSRTGRSVLAAVLRESLAESGFAATHLRLEHWKNSTDHWPTPNGMRGNYDLEGTNQALKAWRNGGTLDIMAPHGGIRMSLPANGILIVEGALAFSVEAIPRRSLSLFVESSETARRKGFLSEHPGRDLTPAHTEALYHSHLTSDEYREINDLRQNADGIVIVAYPEKIEK